MNSVRCARHLTPLGDAMESSPLGAAREVTQSGGVDVLTPEASVPVVSNSAECELQDRGSSPCSQLGPPTSYGIPSDENFENRASLISVVESRETRSAKSSSQGTDTNFLPCAETPRETGDLSNSRDCAPAVVSGSSPPATASVRNDVGPVNFGAEGSRLSPIDMPARSHEPPSSGTSQRPSLEGALTNTIRLTSIARKCRSGLDAACQAAITQSQLGVGWREAQTGHIGRHSAKPLTCGDR